MKRAHDSQKVKAKENLKLSLTALGIIYNRISHLVLRTRQIEHVLVNVNRSLRSRKMLENDIKCYYSVNRGCRVFKTPYDMLSMFSAKRKENDTAMFIITTPVDNSK